MGGATDAIEVVYAASSEIVLQYAGVAGPPGASAPAPFYGQANFMQGATITVAAAGVYQSTGLTATVDSDVAGVAAGDTAFSLANISAATRKASVFASFDGTSTGAAQTFGLRLAVNGSGLPDTECRATTSAAGAIAKLQTQWLLTLGPGDEVSVEVANFSSTNAINWQRGRLIVNGGF